MPSSNGGGTGCGASTSSSGLLAGLIGLVFVGTVVWLSLRYSLGVRSLDDVWEFLST